MPLAVRVVQRNHHHSALFTALYHGSLFHKPSLRPFASTLHFYSSSAKRPSSDDNLLRVLESEIKYSEESDDHDGVGFSFSFFI